MITDTKTMISMSNITKSFGNNTILRNFNLNVIEGTSTVILGGSGSGKSVCLKCLLGILEPDNGEIVINNISTYGLSQKKRQQSIGQIGMLFQNAALFDSLSVWRNIAFGLIEGLGMHPDQAYDIAISKLAQVGLKSHIATLLPNELSGGMRKRVGLARAIATEPKILFFDEPTTGLDPIMGQVIDELIVQSVKELGATAVTITHDMQSLRRIADEVVMLYEGRDIWHGAVTEIDSSDNPYLRQFVTGSSQGPIQMPILKAGAKDKNSG